MSSFSIPPTSYQEQFSVENGIQNIRSLTSAVIVVVNNLKIFFTIENEDDSVEKMFDEADETPSDLVNDLVEEINKKAARNYKKNRTLNDDLEDRRSVFGKRIIMEKNPELN